MYIVIGTPIRGNAQGLLLWLFTFRWTNRQNVVSGFNDAMLLIHAEMFTDAFKKINSCSAFIIPVLYTVRLQTK